MGDWHSPDIREMMIEMIRNLTSQAWVDHIKSKIDDSRTYLEPEHYGAKESLTEDQLQSHLFETHSAENLQVRRAGV